MKTTTQQLNVEQGKEHLNLLLVGNNPMELGTILGKIQQISGRRIITEIAFDVRSLFERLAKFKPNFILIDDNIGKTTLHEAVRALADNRKTRDVPVTVLKNSNYQESTGASSILDYILKQNLSPEAILHALQNSLKLRRTQLFLYKSYNLRKKQLAGSVV